MDDIFICIFLNENAWIPIKISLQFVPQGPINNIPALVQIMAWHRPGDKPLSGPMIGRLPMHICVTWPQWVNHKKWVVQMENTKFLSTTFLLPMLVFFHNFATKFGITNFSYQCWSCTWLCWGRDKMAANFLMTISKAFSWTKIYKFQ